MFDLLKLYENFACSIPVCDSEFFLSIQFDEHFLSNFLIKLQTSIQLYPCYNGAPDSVYDHPTVSYSATGFLASDLLTLMLLSKDLKILFGYFCQNPKCFVSFTYRETIVFIKPPWTLRDLIQCLNK